MSAGWSLFVIVLIVASLVGCAWLLWVNRTAPVDQVGRGEPLPTEHDGIQELNNPLPAWWSWLFIVTIVFGVVYLAAYPGLGAYAGLLGWTSQGRYDAEVASAEAIYGPLYAELAARPIAELTVENVMTKNPQTLRQDAPAYIALKIMEQHEITVLPIVNAEGEISGIIHLHDILGKGEFKFNET